MPLPHRNNPKILTNWFNTKTEKSKKGTRRAYYSISTKEKGKLKIEIREEKKRLGGSGELERPWYGWLEFELNTQFAKDLRTFLNEHMGSNVGEVKL